MDHVGGCARSNRFNKALSSCVYRVSGKAMVFPLFLRFRRQPSGCKLIHNQRMYLQIVSYNNILGVSLDRRPQVSSIMAAQNAPTMAPSLCEVVRDTRLSGALSEHSVEARAQRSECY